MTRVCSGFLVIKSFSYRSPDLFNYIFFHAKLLFQIIIYFPYCIFKTIEYIPCLLFSIARRKSNIHLKPVKIDDWEIRVFYMSTTKISMENWFALIPKTSNQVPKSHIFDHYSNIQ